MQAKVILLAHGSRDPRWRQPFENLLTSIREQLGEEKTELAYMEFCSPNIDDVVSEAYAQGIMKLKFLPLFMAAGAHLRDDVPVMFENLMKEKPGLEIELLDPIGENPVIQKAILELVLSSLR